MTSGSLTLLTTALLGAWPASTPPRPVWFDTGHRLVATIAEARLTSGAAAAVRRILGGESLAEASLWADQIKGARRETGPLHYVNIPLAADGYRPERDCPAGRCIIAAIEHFRARLTDRATSPMERAEALRFLIHLVADLHQPLHVADNHDRGGNLTQVRIGGRGSNLHKVWDGELAESVYPDEAAHLAHLRDLMKTLDLDALGRGSVIDWAMEGHALARQAYDFPRNRQLGQEYVSRNIAAVDLALIKAGVRLTRMLNEALSTFPAEPGAPSPALPAGSYSDTEARQHVGETATIVGIVATVRRVRSGNIYLNFGADYPRQTLSGAILNPRDPALLHLDSLAGKRVAVRGLIRLYKGTPEILIESVGQVTVIE